MPLSLPTARILVVTKNETDKQYMVDFFQRTPFATPVFVVNEWKPTDDFDFVVFDAHSLTAVRSVNDFNNLKEADQDHIQLLERYMRDSADYIVYFGEYYHNLNRERCPSANSKFTLFARMREMIEFLNEYKL